MAMPRESDLEYLLRRAEQEAVTAIVVDDTAGSPAHHELSRRYSALAVRALTQPKGRAVRA